MNELEQSFVEITSGIVAAFVANNPTHPDKLPEVIQSVYDSLKNLQTPPEPEVVPQEPAVSIRASVKPDFIVCLEDGKKLKMLKRHLMTHYNMTPEQYRAKWNLPADYPMTAPNYAAKRAELAKKIGLGVKPKASASVVEATPAPETVVQTEVEPAAAE